jgi:hypothetical protein
MPEPNLFKIFTSKLSELNVPYMVTGSVASIVYGEPRVTHDIDIVLTLSLSKIDEFIKLFPEDQFYCPPVEVVKNEVLRDARGHCNVLHHDTGFKADIYFAGNEEFQHWALENVKIIDFSDAKLPLAPVEYVIVKKLEFYREGKSQKHLSDIKSMLDNSAESIDFDLLKTFITKFNLKEEWEMAEKAG